MQDPVYFYFTLQSIFISNADWARWCNLFANGMPKCVKKFKLVMHYCAQCGTCNISATRLPRCALSFSRSVSASQATANFFRNLRHWHSKTFIHFALAILFALLLLLLPSILSRICIYIYVPLVVSGFVATLPVTRPTVRISNPPR